MLPTSKYVPSSTTIQQLDIADPFNGKSILRVTAELDQIRQQFSKSVLSNPKMSESKVTNQQLQSIQRIYKLTKSQENANKQLFIEGQNLLSQFEGLSLQISNILPELDSHPEVCAAVKQVAKIVETLQETTCTQQNFLTSAINFSSMCDEISFCLQLSEKLGIPPSEVTDSALLQFQQAEKADRAYKELCAEESKIVKQPPRSIAKQKRKCKGRSQVNKKGASSHTTCESPSIQLNKSSVPEQSLDSLRSTLCREWLQVASPAFHPRVKRWRIKNLGEIPLFTDLDATRKIVYRYAHSSHDELAKMKEYHNLPGTEKFISNKIYSFPTKTGVGMMCRMQRKGYPPVSGVLYIGINISDNEIYHLCFEEKISFMQRFDVFTGPSIDPLNITADNSSNPEWEHVGSYNATVSKQAVVKLSYPARGSSLELFPMREDLLPPIFPNISAKNRCA